MHILKRKPVSLGKVKITWCQVLVVNKIKILGVILDRHLVFLKNFPVFSRAHNLGALTCR